MRYKAHAYKLGGNTSLCGTLGAALTASIFTSLMTITPAHAGPDACTIAGNVATCSGDQSAGVTNLGGAPDFTSPPIDTLNVDNLTGDITPGTGVAGIEFEGQIGQDVTVNVDTGTNSIITSNTNAPPAIDLFSEGDLILDFNGTIQNIGNNSNLIGFNGQSNTVLNVDGTLTGLGNGVSVIQGTNLAGGTLTINSDADIIATGAGSIGIFQTNNVGPTDVTITSNGTITTGGAGISLLGSDVL